jgi:radical SAM superfamily enzyme YgiQ (UPF0313 family)
VRTSAYFIASFPGSTKSDMLQLRGFIQKHGLYAEQMQDFIPLPMTLASAMYYSGQDPWTKTTLTVAKSASERHTQRRALLGPRDGLNLTT